MTIIEFENVSFLYSPGTTFCKQALKEINLKIEAGSFVGLIGHTGSGKSTLIQLMNGLLSPTSGCIYFEGSPIQSKEFNKKELRQKVGLVFQYPEYQLFETTVLRDVAYGPLNQGISEEEALRQSKEALSLVGIGPEDYEKSPFELSGGQKRRVAVAGILAMKPEVMVLDEPAAGLDPQGKKEILDLIRQIHEETGMTVLLSSHSMEDMAEYAERLLVLADGEIRSDGAPAEVFNDIEGLERIGLRPPQMVYLMAALKKRGYEIEGTALTVQEAEEQILKLWRRVQYDT